METDMEEFFSFMLNDRKIDEETVKLMKDEKIDPSAVLAMQDNELAKYLTKHGDRMAVVQFCRREEASTSQSGSPFLSSVAQRLKEKMNKRGNNVEKIKNNKSIKLSGNQNALKGQRRFQLGWKHYDGKEFKQVREINGGGTRDLKGCKSLTMGEILKTGIELFFPNGVCKKGKVEEFDISIQDLSEENLLASQTLIAQYELRQMKMLRLYICTKPKVEVDNLAENEDIHVKEKNDLKNVTDHEQRDGGFPQEEIIRKDTTTEPEEIIRKDTTTEPEAYICDFSPDDVEKALVDYAITQSLSSDDEIQFKTFLEDSSNSTWPLPSSTSTPKEPKKLKIHRGHIFSDINDAIKNELICVWDTIVEVEMVLPNGVTEQGEDSGGLWRDALSEYWETFYKKCTSGNAVCVPVIRHDMKDTWAIIAKVIVIGMNTVGYFPIRIAQPFIDRCLGEVTPDNDLLKVFLDFVPIHEKNIMEQAEKDFGDEELLDFLEAHDVKCIVNEKNWDKIILEIAHKELIQEAAYIADCWSPILQNHLKPQTGGISLKDLRNALQPTPKKVLACLTFDKELKPKDLACAGYIKKFIRQSSADLIRRFLRFCTGADILICTAIHVRFIEPVSEFSRNPVGHTCGCVLEMPNTYNSALELAEEFNELLMSNVWVMDMI